MKYTEKALISRVRLHLKVNRIRQYELAEKMGMTLHTLNGTLCGARKLRMCEFFKLCEALDVPPTYFIENAVEVARRD